MTCRSQTTLYEPVKVVIIVQLEMPYTATAFKKIAKVPQTAALLLIPRIAREFGLNRFQD